MPTFEFWYDEIATFKAYFKAENLEQAEELLRQATNGEIAFDDLPEFADKSKGLDLRVDEDSLGEI